MATGDFKNGTGLTGAILAQGQLGTSAAAILPAVAASTYVKIAKVILANESGSAVTVTYGANKSGSTAGAAGTLAGKGWSLGAAGSSTATMDVTEFNGMVLGPGDFLSGLASAATSVTYTISGAVSA